jgi:hypothetical protein
VQGLWQHETDLTIDERDPPLQALLETRSGLAGRSGTRPARVWNRAKLKKKHGKEKPGVTRQDPVKNPVATSFCFFLLKQRRFDFFKKN